MSMENLSINVEETGKNIMDLRKKAGLKGKGKEKEKEARNCLKVPIATVHWRQGRMVGAHRLQVQPARLLGSASPSTPPRPCPLD